MSRKLRLIGDGTEWIGGVCAGVAYLVGIQVWLVRLIWALTFFLLGYGLLLYIILWIFVPKWKETPADFEEITGD